MNIFGGVQGDEIHKSKQSDDVIYNYLHVLSVEEQGSTF